MNPQGASYAAAGAGRSVASAAGAATVVDGPMSVDTLANSQRSLLAAIVGTECPSQLVADLPGGGERGLAVYRHAYLARLREALADNYSALALALGDARFEGLADRYARAHPPTDPHLRPYGSALVTFMEAVVVAGDPEGLVAHPAFIDLARLDWALRAAFDARDACPIDGTALAGLAATDWPRLCLHALPSARLVPLEWAVEAAWHLLSGADPSDPPELPAPRPHAHSVLVWRPQLETRWRALDAEEHDMVAALLAGASFASLCAQLVGSGHAADQAGARAVTYLQQWLADGLLAGFSLAS